MESVGFLWRMMGLLWPSVAVAGATAIAGAIVGWFVMLRREALVALALPHVVIAGAALGMRMGWPEIAPAIGTVGLTVAWLSRAQHSRISHALLPAVYLGGLSLSFLLIANMQAHLAELENRFTGMDVAVTVHTALITVPLLLMPALICTVLWRRWVLLAQSPAAAQLAGLHPSRWNALFLSLLSAFVLLSTNALGTVMVLVMLFLPCATMLPWTRRIPTGLIGSVMLASIFLLTGFILSIQMDWPLSHSCGAVGVFAVALSHSLSRIVHGPTP